MIPNQQTVRQIHRPVLCQIQDHPRPGFSPRMVRDAELRLHRFRMKRTMAPVVDIRSAESQLPLNPAVQRANRVLVIEPSRDSRLIGDDEHVEAPVVGKAYRLSGAINPTKSLGRTDIVVVVIENPILNSPFDEPKRVEAFWLNLITRKLRGSTTKTAY